MKKILLLFVALCMVLSLVGCSGEENTSDELQKYNEFLTNFNNLVSNIPNHNIIQLNSVPLDDNTTEHVFRIEDTVLGESYRLGVNTNKASKVTRVLLSKARDSSSDLQFAVFSLFVYKSMGFPAMEADTFYEKYDLLSTEKILESDVCGVYEITSYSIEVTNEITFSIKS